jgi:molecular chaperone GrpE
MSQETKPPDDDADISKSASGDGEAALETNAADEAIQEELAKLQQEVGNLKELYLRKLSDFDNYRKRQEKEMLEFQRFANVGLMRECLPVLDNMERALEAPGGDGDGLRQGVELVLKQFKDVLAKHGLEEVNPAGQLFDPAHHEAIQRIESTGVREATVTQVMQKGYVVRGRLIRPALVVVAMPAAAPEAMALEQDPRGPHG